MEKLKLRDEYIKLGQALKAAGWVDSGVEAKIVIQNGHECKWCDRTAEREKALRWRCGCFWK